MQKVVLVVTLTIATVAVAQNKSEKLIVGATKPVPAVRGNSSVASDLDPAAAPAALLSTPVTHTRKHIGQFGKFTYFLRGTYSARNFAAGALTAGVPRIPYEPVRPIQPVAGTDAEYQEYQVAMEAYGTAMDTYRRKAQEEVRWRGRRLIAGFAQSETREFMQKFLLASIFREDPRYLASQGQHSGGYRMGYALSRLVVTTSDSDKRTVNFANLLGTGGAAAAERYYYDRALVVPQLARRQHMMKSVGANFAMDALSNVIMEFVRHRGH